MLPPGLPLAPSKFSQFGKAVGPAIGAIVNIYRTRGGVRYFPGQGGGRIIERLRP